MNYELIILPAVFLGVTLAYYLKEKYYEFGPLNILSDCENYTIAKIKQLLKK